MTEHLLPTLLGRLAALRRRQAWVVIHRWAGLGMAAFLILTGLTGSLLAFMEEIEGALHPELFLAPPPAPGAQPLDIIALRDRAEALVPDAWIYEVALYREDGATQIFWLEPSYDPVTGATATLAHDELFLDPYTGMERGRRLWGDLDAGTVNLMPFVYRLHYELALGTVGAYALGIVALVWTLDCFVGFHLTFPRVRPFWQKAFWRKWRPAWALKPSRLTFDLHRAGSLWTWAALLVLAWSSVGLSLQEVYHPVTSTLFEMGTYPEYEEGTFQARPGMSWREALLVGQRLMAAEAPRHGVILLREDSLYYDPYRTEFTYWAMTEINSSDNATGWFGVVYDANSGALRSVDPWDWERTGDVVTRWLYALHMAQVWGLPFRIFICVMGVVVAMLSVTGVIIWMRKRRSR